MVVNRRSKIGLFEKSNINAKGLLAYDFNTDGKKYLGNYLEWKAGSVSPNGKRIAITTISSTKRACRTELVVLEYENGKVLLDTNDYFVYDTLFNSKGDKILVVADKQKPFCYNFTLGQVTAELPKQIRAYKGDVDLENDIFIAPCEKDTDTCYLFDFNSGRTELVKLETKAVISRVKFSPDFTCIYLVTSTNILYCLDRNYNIKWAKDFNYLGKLGGRISPSGIFITEDGQFLSVATGETETNNWGAEYVVNGANGDIIRQIDGYQFRGRFATPFFDNKVLLHTFKTIDLKTGQVSENAII